VYITTHISQWITQILRAVNFFNYYIAAVQYPIGKYYTAKKAIAESFRPLNGLLRG
jgi:hypothetical protein